MLKEKPPLSLILFTSGTAMLCLLSIAIHVQSRQASPQAESGPQGVSRVQVTVKNARTGEEKSAATNESGEFSLGRLPAGKYVMRLQHELTHVPQNATRPAGNANASSRQINTSKSNLRSGVLRIEGAGSIPITKELDLEIDEAAQDPGSRRFTPGKAVYKSITLKKSNATDAAPPDITFEADGRSEVRGKITDGLASTKMNPR